MTINNCMKAKFKKDTIVLTDYFTNDPGNFKEYKILDINFYGSQVTLSLQDLTNNITYTNWGGTHGSLVFKVKEYDRLFFTKQELRMRKLMQLYGQ